MKKKSIISLLSFTLFIATYVQAKITVTADEVRWKSEATHDAFIYDRETRDWTWSYGQYRYAFSQSESSWTDLQKHETWFYDTNLASWVDPDEHLVACRYDSFLRSWFVKLREDAWQACERAVAYPIYQKVMVDMLVGSLSSSSIGSIPREVDFISLQNSGRFGDFASSGGTAAIQEASNLKAQIDGNYAGYLALVEQLEQNHVVLTTTGSSTFMADFNLFAKSLLAHVVAVNAMLAKYDQFSPVEGFVSDPETPRSSYENLKTRLLTLQEQALNIETAALYTTTLNNGYASLSAAIQAMHAAYNALPAFDGAGFISAYTTLAAGFSTQEAALTAHLAHFDGLVVAQGNETGLTANKASHQALQTLLASIVSGSAAKKSAYDTKLATLIARIENDYSARHQGATTLSGTGLPAITVSGFLFSYTQLLTDLSREEDAVAELLDFYDQLEVMHPTLSGVNRARADYDALLAMIQAKKSSIAVLKGQYNDALAGHVSTIVDGFATRQAAVATLLATPLPAFHDQTFATLYATQKQAITDEHAAIAQILTVYDMVQVMASSLSGVSRAKADYVSLQGQLTARQAENDTQKIAADAVAEKRTRIAQEYAVRQAKRDAIQTAYNGLPEVDDAGFVAATAALEALFVQEEAAYTALYAVYDALEATLGSAPLGVATARSAYQQLQSDVSAVKTSYNQVVAQQAQLMTLVDQIDAAYGEQLSEKSKLVQRITDGVAISDAGFLAEHDLVEQAVDQRLAALEAILKKYDDVAALTQGSFALLTHKKSDYDLLKTALLDARSAQRAKKQDYEKMLVLSDELVREYAEREAEVNDTLARFEQLPAVDTDEFLAEHELLVPHFEKHLARLEASMKNYDAIDALTGGDSTTVPRSKGDYDQLKALLGAKKAALDQKKSNALLLKTIGAEIDTASAVHAKRKDNYFHVFDCLAGEDVHQKELLLSELSGKITAEKLLIDATLAKHAQVESLSDEPQRFVTAQKADLVAIKTKLDELLHVVQATIEVSSTEVVWSNTATGESFTYVRATGDWEYRQGSQRWSFTAATGVWKNEQSGETWTHDAANGWWENSFSFGSGGQKWVYDEASNLWHYAHAASSQWKAITPTEWSYATTTTTSQWSFVPRNEEWEYVPMLSEWKKKGTPVQVWRFHSDNTAGQWENRQTNERWLYDAPVAHRSSDTTHMLLWDIVGQDAPGGYDYSHWALYPQALRSKLGPFEHVAWNAGTPEVSDKTGYLYDQESDLWYPNHTQEPLTSEPGRCLLPLFPPTPFAAQVARVKAVLAYAVMPWGSKTAGSQGDVGAGKNGIDANGVVTLSDVNDMYWAHTLKVSGDVEIRAEFDAAIRVGTGVDGEQVTIEPAADAAFAHLVFHVAKGKELTVNIKNDLLFRGRASDNTPLFVTFRGEGTTRFRLPSGRSVAFGNDEVAGVKVHVLMDQKKAEALTNEVSQVMFDAVPCQQDVSAQDADSYITFGRASSFGFLSSYASGKDVSDQAGYGSVAFDVSRKGVGRLVLELLRGVTAGDGKDAAYTVYGSLVGASGAGGAVVASDVRTNRAYGKRAGIAAIMRITDDLVAREHAKNPYDPTVAELKKWHERVRADRRGLLVKNHNATLPAYASNLEKAPSVQESSWAKAQSLQTGFVLGCNGRMMLDDATFLDYIGGSSNTRFSLAQHGLDGGQGGADENRVKLHNPSALLVDGLGPFAQPSANSSWDMAYEGAEQAVITLKGNAGIFVRCGASSKTGALLNAQGTIGSGLFNGVRCVLDTEHNALAYDEHGNPKEFKDGMPACLDGEHAFDIEGPLCIESVDGKFHAKGNGFITVPSLALDHAGREILAQGDVHGQQDGRHPLYGLHRRKIGARYECYNTSSVLINAPVTLKNVTWVHSDVLRNFGKHQVPSITTSALPALIGGERSALYGDTTGGKLLLDGSVVACHESLVMAGVRCIVHEGEGGRDNASSFVAYHQGRKRSSLLERGVVVQLGSVANRMADGSIEKGSVAISAGEMSTNSLRDAFIEVYRSQPANRDEVTVSCVLTSDKEAGVPERKKAFHRLFLAHDSQINIGWPTSQGDALSDPWLFDKALLQTYKEAGRQTLFSPSAFGSATFLVDGGPWALTARDSSDQTPSFPVKETNVGGVVYVDYGGHFSVSEQGSMFIDTVIARHLAAGKAAGQITCNAENVRLGSKGKIQPYMVDYEVDKEATGKHAGYVLLDAVSPEVTISPSLRVEGFTVVKSVPRGKFSYS